jgi:RNA polymerase sigma-70 factor (ECF subfamily)
MTMSSSRLERARAGSRGALEELLEAQGRRLLPFLRVQMGPLLRGQLESADLLQETLLAALAGFEGFRGEDEEALFHWMARIAANQVRDQVQFHRRERRDARRRKPLHESAVMASARSVLSRLAIQEGASALERALDDLPEQQRDVVLLRRFEGLSYAEIGERLDRSADAARMLYGRAVAALAAAMGGNA